jgi:hypothetical protein
MGGPLAIADIEKAPPRAGRAGCRVASVNNANDALLRMQSERSPVRRGRLIDSVMERPNGLEPILKVGRAIAIAESAAGPKSIALERRAFRLTRFVPAG